MIELNWRKAKTRELFVIALRDDFATNDDRMAAVAELQRRQKKQHGRENQKIRREYPR